MRNIVSVLLFVALAGCTQSKSGESSEKLIAKDKVCATLTTAAACDADTADGCHWEPLAVSQIACPTGETCPVQPTGICEGASDSDPCVIADQCARIDDAQDCGAHEGCGWVAAVCEEPAHILGADGGTDACPAYVCQRINPCTNLNGLDCTNNSACELQDVQSCTGGSACPPIQCPNNEPNCPQPICTPTPPTCSTSVVCVEKPLVCGGGTGGGSVTADAGSPPPTGSGTGGSAQPL